MNKQIKLILFLGLFLPVLSGFSQIKGFHRADVTRILFILDASSSMLQEMENGRSKMDVAKEVLGEVIDSLRIHRNLELGLRVYGHNYKANVVACDDTALEVGFSANNHDQIIRRLGSITPKGGTPLAYSLEQTVKDFPNDKFAYNVVIIITDGAESCKGDPCKVSAKLQSEGIILKPFIISLDGKGEFTDMFSCLGQQFTVTDIPSFKGALDESVRMTLYGPTVTLSILNSKKEPYRNDLTVTLHDKSNPGSHFQLIHYLSPEGTTDTLLLNHGTTYDIEVSTIPPVIIPNVTFAGNTHTNVDIPAAQGGLNLAMRNATYYKEPVVALVRKSGATEVINTQLPNTRQFYLQGSYDIEVLTRPPAKFYGVSIDGERNTILEVEEPGMLHISASVKGLATIYEVDGSYMELVERIPLSNPGISLAIQPGKYQLAYRALNAKGSKFTVIKEFEIKSREPTRISVY